MGNVSSCLARLRLRSVLLGVIVKERWIAHHEVCPAFPLSCHQIDAEFVQQMGWRSHLQSLEWLRRVRARLHQHGNIGNRCASIKAKMPEPVPTSNADSMHLPSRVPPRPPTSREPMHPFQLSSRMHRRARQIA